MNGVMINMSGKQELVDIKNLEEIKEKSQAFISQMSFYRCAMMEIETKFNVLNEEFSFQNERNPISNIKCRLKSPVSIRNKLNKLNKPYTIEATRQSLHDIAGIRVCCPFIDDVYLIADALLRQNDITLIAKKDYIAEPKPNGYRSLHLIVSVPIFFANDTHDVEVEIQLRTIAMDSWATLEHQLRYKKNVVFTDEMAEELFVCSELSAELDRKMENLYNDIFGKFHSENTEKNC